MKALDGALQSRILGFLGTAPLPLAPAPTAPISSAAAGGLTPADLVLLRSGAPAGVVVRDGFLGARESMQLRDWADGLRTGGRLRPSGMGREDGRWRESAVRGDRICFQSDLTSAERGGLAVLQGRMEGLVRQLEAEQPFPGRRITGRTSLQVAAYEGGGARYHRHRDAQRRAGGGAERFLTAIYYLNEGWSDADGGCLRLHLPSEKHWDISPRSDRLVVFRSDVTEHEVLPTAAARLAITTWIYAERAAAYVSPAAPLSAPALHEDRSIFVGIVSYRDSELKHTVRDLFATAARPERVSCGVVLQADAFGVDAKDLFLDADDVAVDKGTEDRSAFFLSEAARRNLRCLVVRPEAAAGPAPARAALASLLGAEDFVLSVDSHMRFRPNWDAFLLCELEKCSSMKMGKCNKEMEERNKEMEERNKEMEERNKETEECNKEMEARNEETEARNEERGKGGTGTCAERSAGAILTTYPAGYALPYGRGQALETRPTVLVPCGFDADGMLKQRGRLVEPRGAPIPSPLWAAGFNFCAADTWRSVPYDAELAQLFRGEEASMAARLFTAGLDFYAPSEQVCYHLWTRGHRPTFWEQAGGRQRYSLSPAAQREGFARDAAKGTSQRRVARMLQEAAADGGARGLGSARGLRDFERRAGIDLRGARLLPGAERGGLDAACFVDEGGAAAARGAKVMSLLAARGAAAAGAPTG